MPLKGIRTAFFDRFGYDPAVIATAPGRVNLIGEHTDYNDGFVFPAAIDRGLMLAASIREPQSDLLSAQLGEGEAFEITKTFPGFTTSWSQYPAGMGWAIQEYTEQQLPNLNAYVDSFIPIGSGVSSSAAIELAFGVVWSFLAKLALDNRELAKLGQICENKFVGVNSGIMDQMACALGKENNAIFLDTRTLEIEYVPVPENLAVVLCDTKKARALTSSAYNERRSQCEEACAAMGISKLRDADLRMLYSVKSRLSDVVYRRAKHVITENDRCIQFKGALNRGDLDTIGLLMKDSHNSLRFDYEVSCEELDTMAQAAWAAPGCVGARMTGAGFGGACVALVEAEKVSEFTKSVLDIYNLATGLHGEVMACRIVDGARILEA